MSESGIHASGSESIATEIIAAWHCSAVLTSLGMVRHRLASLRLECPEIVASFASAHLERPAPVLDERLVAIAGCRLRCFRSSRCVKLVGRADSDPGHRRRRVAARGRRATCSLRIFTNISASRSESGSAEGKRFIGTKHFGRVEEVLVSGNWRSSDAVVKSHGTGFVDRPCLCRKPTFRYFTRPRAVHPNSGPLKRRARKLRREYRRTPCSRF